MQTAKQQGLNLPLLVRFPCILKDRIYKLKQAVNDAMTKYGQSANFYPVYPIKVNQQKRVIQEIQKVPGVGLEAGSKAELMAILSIFNEKSLIVCNGYKDSEYIRLSMITMMLGHKVILMIEKPAELDIIIKYANQLKLKPILGIRLRLSTIGKGNWQNTGGEKSKFGLKADQCIQVIRKLKTHGLDGCLQVIHAHLGSQIANIKDIEKGIREVAGWWRALCQRGLNINTVDVGGGLGVDYEGTNSRNFCSMNYTMHQYAELIVKVFAVMAKEINQPMPHLISESGRAMTAHHAVLLTQVIDTETPQNQLCLK